MKNLIKYSGIALMMAFGVQTQAQEVEVNVLQIEESPESARYMPNFRYYDQRGLDVFEPKKDTDEVFNGVNVRFGGAFAIQFQGLDHENSGGVPLMTIGDNFNLPTANLDLDVHLYDGVRMHLRTYLSSRHHPEPYVKGGYIQIDKLNFISEGFMEDVMDKVRIKIGHMENNYGDMHFRRSDNAQSLHNPFVGNLIMDAFTTEVGAEVYYIDNGFLAMGSMTNGKLNQSVSAPHLDDPAILGTKPSYIAKLGYDNYFTDSFNRDDLRVRLTGSIYHTSESANAYLYSADRAGSRYYLVMEGVDATPKGNFTSGRFNPGLRNELTSIMINPFLKYNGLEFFGTYERATGKAAIEADDRTFNQYAGELLYRFGNNENFYVGGRYNFLDGELASGEDIDISRYNLAAGWFMTRNILAKVEYVNQEYNGFAPTDILHEGSFNGIMFEAAISF
jgi:hypothetical protein